MMFAVGNAYIRQIALETSSKVVYDLGRQPTALRTFSQRLSMGFNDAISSFNDDGWSLMACDGVEDVIISMNSSKNMGTLVNRVNTLPVTGGILYAKASMLLQDQIDDEDREYCQELLAWLDRQPW